MKVVTVLVALIIVEASFLGWLGGWWYAKKQHNHDCENCQWAAGQFKIVSEQGHILVDGPKENAVQSGSGYRRVSREDLGKIEIRAGETVVVEHEFKSNPSAYDDNTVDMDGLILTESGGDSNAVGDAGKSLGLCQISKAAWEDVNQFRGTYWDYDGMWKNPSVNRAQADAYVNHVIPEKYFKAWGIPDSVDARIAAYKYGPTAFKDIILPVVKSGHQLKLMVCDRVRRDIEKYHQFVESKNEKTASTK